MTTQNRAPSRADNDDDDDEGDNHDDADDDDNDDDDDDDISAHENAKLLIDAENLPFRRGI